ncbi:UDP-N-acetylglucosamine--N-acetylmuramyl-(pentapeptide) pyrophosphoryl-undecaprenol N-acetylglucosamine transferase [Canibacter zhuwentaonis]|uniref:UDP-N-acetylglucosamine--N-acetylmuramyl- (pentapeptide) pyrophosphoryl-undecaprenol N-acetylglucosamine transferase n=1 Tax=Canibacter zhuwentaonis TaxID=2837491 RepID=UPI0032B3A90C
MRYLLAGGGTAGHVNPLLALAEMITAQEANTEIVVLGTCEGLESRLVPERGFELFTIAKLPFPRTLNLYALGFAPRFIKAVVRTVKLMRSRRIDAVVGFGGYASAPAYAAAKLLGVPYVIHEANALPGIANRAGALGTEWVGVTFANTPIRGAKVIGMPLRKEIAELDRAAQRASAAQFFGLDANRKTLLVTGGSLGARGINEGIAAGAAQFAAAGVQVLHIWGEQTESTAVTVAGYKILPYCDRMELAFSLADFVISRAGATTVSEIAGLSLPAVFVPYRHGNGEQARNCAEVVNAGGALLAEDAEITPEWVKTQLLPLLQNDYELRLMSERAGRSACLNGTEQLYEMVRRALRA